MDGPKFSISKEQNFLLAFFAGAAVVLVMFVLTNNTFSLITSRA